MKSIRVALIFFLFSFLLVSCTNVQVPPKTGSITIDNLQKSEPGENFFFQIQVDQKMLESNVPISIQTSGKTTIGQVHVVLKDPAGVTVWDPGAFGGEFSANTYYQPKQVGLYQLGIVWDKPIEGPFSLSYQAERLSAAALIPGLGMMLVAILYIVIARRQGGSWGYLGLGALLWVVTVAVKFLIASALNPSIYKALFSAGTLFTPGDILFYLYVGFLTGITEVVISWLLVRYTKLGKVNWSKALAFGIGFGAFEALLLGLSSTGTMATAILAPQTIPASAFGQLLVANNVLIGLAPIFERLATILVHIICAVVLFYGVQMGQARWLWFSFMWKTLFDAVAGFAQFWGVETPLKMWTIEGILIVFGLISLWAIRKISEIYPKPKQADDLPAVVDIAS